MKHAFAALLLAALPGLASAQNYFQQEVNYKINVSLNDDKHELSGNEQIEYINNSPEQLTYIYFHLWPNAYKNNKTAFAKQARVNGSRKFYFAKASERGYIDGLSFTVNGKTVKLEYEQEDVAKLILNEALKPGDRITIQTPFHVKIPGAFSRLGHEGQSYQITQWYPKPAVYDSRGWHQMPYLDQGEFYSEYGSFDVNITLPANYNVGATGVLQTASEIARMNSLAQIAAAKTSFGRDMRFPLSDSKTKTLHYVQDNVHDFAWFADKRYNILKSQVELPVSKRTVTTWILFLNQNAKGWIDHKNDINAAVSGYSELVGEYPYTACTAVEGALGEDVGGMEYPMVTVTMPTAITHEVGHNWFYGILGSNERAHPWQDEGVNCYVENRLAEEKNPNAGQLSFFLEAPFRKIFGLQDVNENALNYGLYKIENPRGLDQAIDLHAARFTKTNYGGIVYMKTPVVFNYLTAYLGKERFDKAMHAYFEKWKFKHPYPEDMQASFEEVSGEKLDWFFINVLQTTKPVNISIKNTSKTPEGGTQVILKNEGKFAAPAPVAAVNEYGQVIESKWTKPFESREPVTFTAQHAASYEIDPEYLLPETDRRDNRIRTSGILRKMERPRLQFLAGMDQNRKQQLYFTPVLGANTADKFMLGAAFYNSSIMAKKINYIAMPMYSFGQNQLTGIGNINYNLATHGNGLIRQVLFGFNFQRFEYFTKYEPSITLNFRRKEPNASRQQLKIALTSIRQQASKIQQPFDPTLSDATFALLHRPEDINGQTITYSLLKKNAIQDIGLQLQYQHLGADFQTDVERSNDQSNAVRGTLTYERYWNEHKKFNARLFGGKFFNPHSAAFYMGLSSSPDYLRETIFLDRAQKSENIRAYIDQTDNKDGAFKNYSPVITNDWMTTLNLQSELPFIPLLDVYLDLGWVGGYDKTFYGTGVALNIGKGFFSLYFPVAGNNFADTFPDDFKDFRQNIRFALNFNMLNPFKLLNDNL